MRTVDTLIAQNDEMRKNPSQTMVDQNYDADTANIIFQSIRSELTAGPGYLLWTVIVITFMSFMVTPFPARGCSFSLVCQPIEHCA